MVYNKVIEKLGIGHRVHFFKVVLAVQTSDSANPLL